MNNSQDNDVKIQTSLCTLLNIQYPIIQSGMSGFTTPELVASVSNAGAIGILGGARLSPINFKKSISRIKEKTNRPFGVNLLLAPPEHQENTDISNIQSHLNTIRNELNIPPSNTSDSFNIRLPSNDFHEKLEIIINEHVPLLSIGMGDPSKFVEKVHKADIKVMSMITTVKEALQVAQGGTDIIAVQGSEAGGHRSTFESNLMGELPLIGTMALVPQIVDAIESQIHKKIPIVATGGITDGRGLVAALSLGASGIMLGTRFLTAIENNVFSAYKEGIISADGTNTTITKVFSGRHARAIRNKFINEYVKAGLEPLHWPYQALLADDIYNAALLTNNRDYFPLLAGQGVGSITKKDQTGSEIIIEIVTEAANVLKRLNHQII